MTPFTAWLAHLDKQTDDGRVLTAPPDEWYGSGMWPVFVFGENQTTQVGTLYEVHPEWGWLRGSGELDVNALPERFRRSPIGAEIDISSSAPSVTVSEDGTSMVFGEWRLEAVVLGDNPVWSQARVEFRPPLRETIEGVVHHRYSEGDGADKCICCPGPHKFSTGIDGVPTLGRDWIYDRIRSLPHDTPIRITVEVIDE